MVKKIKPRRAWRAQRVVISIFRPLSGTSLYQPIPDVEVPGNPRATANITWLRMSGDFRGVLERHTLIFSPYSYQMGWNHDLERRASYHPSYRQTLLCGV